MAGAQADLAELGIASNDGWWQNPTLDDDGEEQVSNAMHEEGEAESDGEETSMHQQGTDAEDDSGNEPAIDGDMQQADDAVARSQLAHVFSDVLAEDGAPAESAAKISTTLDVPRAGRLYKQAVVSQFNGMLCAGGDVTSDRLMRMCQIKAEEQAKSTEGNTAGLQSDVAVIFEAGNGKYCVWYGRVQRMFRQYQRRKTEYTRPVSLTNKLPKVMLRLHYYSLTSKRGARTFKYDHHDDQPVSLESVICTVSFTFSQATMTYELDAHDKGVVADALKTCNRLGRVVGTQPNVMSDNEQHVVDAVCGKRERVGAPGIEYHLLWSDKSKSWEIEANCLCKALIREYEASLI